MTLHFLQGRSLKTRVTLFTLVIFLLSLWSLAFYASTMLREDMQRLLGEQQLSTAALVAADINGELGLRMQALDKVAAKVAPAMQGPAPRLQAILDDRTMTASLFNGGIVLYRADGTVIADTVPAAGRVGVSYADVDTVAAALKGGASTVGRPTINKKLGTPVLGLTVPVRDAQGRVIGAVGGSIQLGQANFLDSSIAHHYAITGGYLLVEPQHRLVVTATDKRRIMEMLPGEGVNPVLDRFIHGFEGSQVFVNPLGVEVLTSIKRIPLADWYVAAMLPTEEAFAPIRNLQQRMLLATLILTLLAAGLTRWMLTRQLAPMLSAVTTLAALSQSETPPQALPVVRQDEIGKLISGFNGLLKTLAQREALLKQVLDTSSVAIFVVDRHGHLIQANQRMAEMFGCTVEALVGQEYVTLIHPLERDVGRQQMLALLASEIPSVDLDRRYWRADHTEFWGHLTGKRLVDADGAQRGLVGVIADISERVQTERHERFRIHTLELLGKGEQLPHILDAIVAGVEQIAPELRCRITASPHGTVSVESAESAAQAYAVYPICEATGAALGQLFVHHRTVHTPSAVERALLEQAVHLARIAMERHAVAQSLQDSEARFRSLMENIPSVAVQGYTPDGTVTFWNRASEQLYGYSAAQALGSQWCELIVPAPRRAEVLAAMGQMLETGVPIPSGEWQLQGRDGQAVSVISSHALVNHLGQQPELFCLAIDLSERKRVEAALHDSERRYRTIIEWTPEAIGVHRNGKVIYVNPAAVQVFGAQSAQELVGKSILELIHPDSRPLAMARAKQVAELGDSVPLIEEKYFKMDGSTMDVEVQATRIVFDGEDANLIAIRDITAHKQAQEKLQLAAKVFSHAREAIMITSAEGNIIDVNEAFTRITGYEREEVLGKNPRLLSSGRQGKEYYATMWRSLHSLGHWYGEVWNRRKNGEVYAEMQTISAVRDAQGALQQYVALFSDITATKQHEQQLERIAHFDALTNLPNRVLLADRLHQAMAHALRREQQTAVAFLDLDGFKAINDSHGHDAGDQLLIALSTRMRQALRDGDTLARLGGDEFVAVLVDLVDLASCVPLLTRLLVAAASPVQVGALSLQVSASLGVTFFPQMESVDADQLLRQADQAMYQAKLAGKNRYHVFDAEQDRSVRGHHESLDHIRHALAERQFVLHYQPKVNMRTGQIMGAEALIRWQHPEQGLLAPAAFLPVIEDHALAIDIGEWVIDTALGQMEVWQAAGLDLRISVNVGARQLQQPHFVDRLRELLAAHPQVAPSCLELEVLETSALEDMAGVSRVIEDCLGMGITFALDDFGTGYSSLTYLKRLPATLLKIDQSFVRDMLDDPDDLAILDGVIGLAAAFRREVIAEGVETIAHGTLLQQLGCDLAQGYGIARPMPADALAQWSRDWRPDPAWHGIRPVAREDFGLLYAGIEHRAWCKALEQYLQGARDTHPEADPRRCHFGRWLARDGAARYGAKPAFVLLDTLHSQAHDLGRALCKLHESGHGDTALARLGELHRLRDGVHRQLAHLLDAPTVP